MPAALADLCVTGARVLCADGDAEPALRPVDLIARDGRVVALDPPVAAGRDAAVRIYDAGGSIVLPGLVNAHTHSYGQVCRMPFANDRLECWMPAAAAAAAALDAEGLALAATMTAVESLGRGVTTVLDHSTLRPDDHEPVIEAYRASGIRVALAPQVADRRLVDTLADRGGRLRERLDKADRSRPRASAELLEDSRRLALTVADEPHLHCLLGPSSPERCSDELLDGLAELARELDVGVHTHLLETPLQRAADDSLGRLDAAGLLGPATSLAHAVHVDAHDRARLAQAGATVVHNPFSNLALGAGRCDVQAANDAGIAVAIGSDGWNCGGAQAVLEAAKLALLNRRPELPADDWLTPRDVWRMATVGGARALNLGGQVGELRVGAYADFVVVNPARAGWLTGVDPLAQAVLGGFGDGLTSVFVHGEERRAGGDHRGVDRERLADAATKAFERMRAGAGDGWTAAGRLRPLLRELEHETGIPPRLERTQAWPGS